ncbi:MAG TPA: hypothetical protein VFM48_00550, partial [Aquabacterium sp.]|nr:hypothetical protein [Aquabacterium sp.]
EISPEVIALREEFLIPPDGDHFRILCDDGAEFIKRPPRRYDWIMVDGYDGQGLPAALSTRSFYERCQAALTDHGVLILNLQADTSQCRQLTQRLMRLFNNQVLAIESDEGGNEIILASSARTMCEGLQQFDARWQALPDVHQTTLAVCSTRVQRALRKCPPDGLNQTSELSPL